METSLHRQLKAAYADDTDQTEVSMGNYRIDAIAGEWLVEIQHGSLAAISAKVSRLLDENQVLVVKPIIANKLIVRRQRKGGKIAGRRKSPKRGSFLDAFDELIYFTRVFPHTRLAVEIVLVSVEEWRYPGHGRRRRRRANDFVVEDQKLLEVHQHQRVETSADLWKLLPSLKLPHTFHTGHLADQLDAQRWVAQRIAYVMRKTGAVKQVGKKGNALLYEIPRKTVKPAA